MPITSPILRSCCCWRSLKKGCYASGIYTAVYFLTSAVVMSQFVYEERMYLIGNQTSPESDSFLEPETITDTTMLVNLLLLVCSVFGILSTCLLFIGVYTDRRYFLLPWIVIVAIDTLVEIIHSGYMFILETINFNPITAILFTLDFFLIIGHVYAFLCVVSQYQELMMRRRNGEDYHRNYVHHQRVLTDFSRSQHTPSQSFHATRNCDTKPTVTFADLPSTACPKDTITYIKKRTQFSDEKTVTFFGVPTDSSAPPSPVHVGENDTEEAITIDKIVQVACVVEVTVENVENLKNKTDNDNDKENEKENDSQNKNHNENDIDSKKDIDNENDFDNVNDIDKENYIDNENDNKNDKDNDNENENVSKNDNDNENENYEENSGEQKE